MPGKATALTIAADGSFTILASKKKYMLLYFRRLFNKDKIKKIAKMDYYSDHYVSL